jgi:predicted PilT family ATPase
VRTLAIVPNDTIKELTMSIKIATKAKFVAAGVAATLAATPAVALSATPSQSISSAPNAAAATIDWKIALKPGPAYPRATGSAEYKVKPGQREFQVEVEHITVLAGKSVKIAVNGNVVGLAKVSSLGIARLDRNTELGQTVPNIVHGSTVAVRTPANTLVASGRF